MIATWMLYTTIVGLLATVAALVLEHAGRALGVQVRFVWVAALAATLLWPIVVNGRLAHRDPAPLPSASMTAATSTLSMSTVFVAGAPQHSSWRDKVMTLPALDNRFDSWLLALWGIASLLILVQLGRSIDAIRRGRRIWKTRMVDGAPVLLSNDLGPAVIGVRDLRIVLPQWTLALEPPLRAVILRHEDEHRRARDPLLLLGAIIATALAPWNVAIWWQCKRLRLAIETDCDARVLEREQDVERYGSLLVTIAERRGPQPPAIAAALTESISNLERRITIMTTPAPRFPRTIATILAAVATVTIAVAVVAPVPAGLAAARPLPVIPVATRATLATPATSVSHLTAGSEPTASLSDRSSPGAVVGAKAPPATPEMESAPVGVNNGRMATPNSNPSAAGALREKIIIRGKATDGDGLPIENAFVTATTQADGSRSAKTNSAGMFALSVPESDGIYLVSFVAGGFETKHVQVKRIGTQTALLANAQLDRVASVAGDTSRTVVREPTDRPTLSNVVVGQGVTSTRPSMPSRADTTVAPATDGALSEFQVTQQARLAQGNTAPSYPTMLRQANVEGEAVVQFVVNVDGMVDMTTFKELKTTHPLFTESVKQALPAMKFIPAMMDNHPVKQMIQMPFVFTLAK